MDRCIAVNVLYTDSLESTLFKGSGGSYILPPDEGMYPASRSGVRDQVNRFRDQFSGNSLATRRLRDANVNLRISICPGVESNLSNWSSRTILSDQYMTPAVLEFFGEPGNVSFPRDRRR